jgi:hypothetical protein
MKKLTYSLIILNSILMFIFISCDFAAGSYPYAERYEIKCGESDLINAIKKFKEDNPEYCLPLPSQLKDGRSSDRDDHWYHVYFYYKKDNEIVNAWIRENNKGTTTFAFVAINHGLELGNWKDINKDFTKKEDSIQKIKFERFILNPVKANVSRRW